MIAFRVGVDVLAKIDKYAERFEREHPGMKVSRSAAIRALIEKGLERS